MEPEPLVIEPPILALLLKLVLEPVAPIKSPVMLAGPAKVLVPPVAVPTAQIFAAPDLRRDTPVMAASTWHSGVGHNDLEAVAVALYPEVAQHLDWLRTWGDARMSGSGACCFVAFDTAAAAAAAHAVLPSSMQGFVARGIDQHPLVFI